MAAGISVLELAGLCVTVERKAIRHVYLRLRGDGSVLLTAPQAANDAALERFILSKRDWLARHMSESGDYAPQYCPSERFPVWGVYASLVMEQTTEQASCILSGDRLLLRLPSPATSQQAKAALDAFYRGQLAAALPAVVAERETAMGLHARRWQLRDMTSRWGSCTPRTGDIRLNLQLAKFPPDCLRYLVTHELAHLRERGHGPAFYALVEAHEPAWRQERARLRLGAPILPPEAGRFTPSDQENGGKISQNSSNQWNFIAFSSKMR